MSYHYAHTIEQPKFKATIWPRTWRNWNSHGLLARYKWCSHSVKQTLVSSKALHISLQPSESSLGYSPERNPSICPHTHRLIHRYSCNSPKLQTTQMSMTWGTSTQKHTPQQERKQIINYQKHNQSQNNYSE